MKGLIFTNLLTYGGAAAALFNPFTGLLIYICFAIVKPESMWYWSVEPGNYSRIVAIALLLGWVMRGCGKWRFGSASAIVLALIAYWCWTLLSAFLAIEPNRAWGCVEQRAKFVLPFVVAITVLDSLQKLKYLTWVVMLSQGYVAYEMNVFYYDGFNRVHEIGFGGMDNNSVAIAMVTGIGLAFFLGLYEQRWWAKIICFGAAIFMAHTVMFAFSRGGMLGLIITSAVAFVLIPRQPKHYFIFLVALLIGIRLAGAEVLNRFASTFADPEERDSSAQSRIELWAACRDVMARYPVFGVGPWCFPVIVTEYGFGVGKSGHSLWLQEGAELGVPGMLLLVSFYVICAKRLWKFRHDRPDLDPWLPSTARMIISSLVGFIISAQFVSLEGLELPFYVVLIGAGALKLLSLPEYRHEVAPKPTRDRGSIAIPSPLTGVPAGVGWVPLSNSNVVRQRVR